MLEHEKEHIYHGSSILEDFYSSIKEVVAEIKHQIRGISHQGQPALMEDIRDM